MPIMSMSVHGGLHPLLLWTCCLFYLVIYMDRFLECQKCMGLWRASSKAFHLQTNSKSTCKIHKSSTATIELGWQWLRGPALSLGLPLLMETPEFPWRVWKALLKMEP